MNKLLIIVLIVSSQSFAFFGDLFSKKKDQSVTNNYLIESVPSKNTVTIVVNGMICSFCAQGIEKKLANHQSVNHVNVDLENKKVTLSLLKINIFQHHLL